MKAKQLISGCLYQGIKIIIIVVRCNPSWLDVKVAISKVEKKKSEKEGFGLFASQGIS